MYLCSNWLAISLWQGVVSMVWSGDDGVEMILWWDVWTWMPSLIVGYATQDLKTLLETNVRQLESTFFLTWLSKCTCACMQDRCLDKDFFERTFAYALVVISSHGGVWTYLHCCVMICTRLGIVLLATLPSITCLLYNYLRYYLDIRVREIYDILG